MRRRRRRRRRKYEKKKKAKIRKTLRGREGRVMEEEGLASSG